MVQAIVDVVKNVSELIKNSREIYDAVKDGIGYLKLKHPDIQKDVAAMCTELGKTCHAVAVASSVVTSFRFNGAPGEMAKDLSRFNDYFIGYKGNNAVVAQRIKDLKGSCHIIQAHAEKLQQKAAQTFSRQNILELFGLHDSTREQRLQAALQTIYDEEKEWYLVVDQFSAAVTNALADVDRRLVTDGLMVPENIPAAAKLLHDYNRLFGELENIANLQAKEIQSLVDDLEK